jgi:uncharacterized delta-60 repeat protein
MRRSTYPIYLFVLMLVLCGSQRALGQAGVLDPTFPVVVNHTVNVVEVLPDGKIFVGGDFTTCNTTPVQRIVRLHANGSTDFTYGTITTSGGADGPVRSGALQPDGKVLIGGLFNNVNGLPRKNIARLDSSGVVDPAFVVGTGASNEVTHIHTNGTRIIMAGFFNSYNGTPAPGLVALHMDGSRDTSFLLPASWVSISAAVVLPNNSVYLVGNFTTYLGTPVNRIVRLHANGTIDTSFNVGAGIASLVHTLAVQPDGKVVVGGAFQTVQGVARNRIARLNADGSLDTTFLPGTGASGGVRTVAIEPGGKIFIGGDFATYNGVTVNRIARLHPDGSLDASYQSLPGTNGTVNTLRVQADGKLLLGGGFTQIQNVSQGRIARLMTDLCLNDTLPPVPLVPILPPVTGICEANVTAFPTATDNCAGLVIATTTNPLQYTTPGTHQIQWTFDDGNGNFTHQFQQVFISGVNTNVTIDTIVSGSSYELKANHIGPGVTYQWIECSGTPVIMAGNTAQQFIPQTSGSYAVIVNEGGCADTSICIPVTISTIGVFKAPEYRTLNVYPNPTTGSLNINLPRSQMQSAVTITDLLGHMVMPPFYTYARTATLDLHPLKPGIYLITVQQGERLFVTRAIRKYP